MKFQIENIGMIENADIEMEGITIIAGENNVGKSTIGKALYAFLHDMDSWKKIYDETCSSRLENFLYQGSVFLDDWCMEISDAKRRRTGKVNQLMKKYALDEGFRVYVEDYQLAEDQKSKSEAENNLRGYLGDYCHEYLALYAKDQTDDIWLEHINGFYEWIQNAIQVLGEIELDEILIQTTRVEQSLNEIFSMQYRKIGSKKCSLKFKDDNNREVSFTKDGSKTFLDRPLRISNHAFFIESPKLFDYLSNTAFGHVQKDYLRYLMSPNIFKKSRIPSPDSFEENDAVKEMPDKVLKEITAKLVEVMGGQAEFLQKIGLEFKDNHISEPIHAVNVSTGLKSMALLEYALRIGAIEDGDILILDEPEINLHPEWQVVYAGTLVELQKKFHLKIIITTHSPYFMRAIECFSDTNNSMDLLNVYRIKKDAETGKNRIENVSYSEFGMTELYEDLSAPLETLEEMLNREYGG